MGTTLQQSSRARADVTPTKALPTHEILLDFSCSVCYNVAMKTSATKQQMRVARVLVSDAEWLDIRTAALYQRVSLGQLLGDLVRQYLKDPKRSPIVRTRRTK